MPYAPASLQFTDADGSAAITNGKSGPGARFSGWTPIPVTFGDSEDGLGDGVLYTFTFGDRMDARFALTQIPNDQQPLLERLRRHLTAGGIVHVITGDVADREYTTCQMVKGAPPELEMTDRQLLEWTVTLTLRNVAPDPQPMLCVYA